MLYIILALVASLALFITTRKTSYSLKNKHVVVFGGSSGIGKQLVYSLLEANVLKVTIVSRSTQKMQEVIDEAQEKYKDKLFMHACDITKKELVKSTVSEIIKQSGRIDCLVNCAGLAVPGYFIEQDEDIFESTMQLDYFGSLYTTKAVVPHMIENGGGHIVFVSSTCGVVGVPGYTTYCPAKYAIVGLCQTLRSELLPYNIGFSMVYPPDTDTPGYAQENLTKPEETRIISGGGKAVSPRVVSDAIVKGVENGDYHIAVDIPTKLCVILSSGLTPFYFPFFDIIMAPICKLVGIIAMKQNDGVVMSTWKNKNKAKN
ncbi:3-dehydrosphinganine reductase [Heterostelium album PN500]|uniref:3-dehydrosphinganine reductase n=1 Tax=Heterostelium pallidum (strain ATCC 26659 / Pp 5 / PN500) TaxID=670386 RepID=D3BQN3_HETP5|nr:3-dehydrosphinganine reductase [Heterostelium album PN500]EFA76453.1 3-dehydrosphinganine reductase [Heterostelium album PN500]|eukprot:XP_020428585.1 3-dehydrosphinganine reductase [Heterostelium album PN500]